MPLHNPPLLSLFPFVPIGICFGFRISDFGFSLPPAIFSQIPLPAPGSIETFLVTAAAVGSMVLLGKKLFPAKRTPAEIISRVEFRQELALIHDKIDQRFFSLSEKIDHLAESMNTRFTQIETRLSQVEAGLARLDERTKPLIQ